MNDPIYFDFTPKAGGVDSTPAAETEVELSAQDLLDLPPAAPVASKASQAPASSRASATVGRAASKSPPPVQRSSWITVPRAAWSVGLAVTAGVVVAANQMYSAPDVPAPAPVIVSSIPQQPDPVPAEEVLPPTLVANPFDESEVFELAPGLSTEEARTAVAELLLERAVRRQAAVGSGGGGVRGR